MTPADALTVLCVAAGAVFYLAGSIGLLRFPDALTRLHALTKADNLGLGLVALGLAFQAAGPRDLLRLAAVWLLALVSAAAVSRLIARHVRDGGA